jgi:hypothetical protein
MMPPKTAIADEGNTVDHGKRVSIRAVEAGAVGSHVHSSSAAARSRLIA